MNKTQIKNLIITIIIAIATMFSYKVTIDPPVNVLPLHTDSIYTNFNNQDTLK